MDEDWQRIQKTNGGWISVFWVGADVCDDDVGSSIAYSVADEEQPGYWKDLGGNGT